MTHHEVPPPDPPDRYRMWSDWLAIIAAVVVLGVVFFLNTVDSGEDSALSRQERAMVSHLRSGTMSTSWIADYSDAQLIELAHEVCDEWESGAGFSEIFDRFYHEAGSDSSFTTGFFIGGATLTLCPEFYD